MARRNVGVVLAVLYVQLDGVLHVGWDHVGVQQGYRLGDVEVY